MEYKILPYSGLEVFSRKKKVIYYGMKREEVRRVVGEEPIMFTKTIGIISPSDLYKQSGFTAYYDKDNKLDALEIYIQEVIIFLFDINISNLSNGKQESIIRQYDKETKTLKSGIISLKLGIRLYSPNLAYDKYESLVAFRKGYFN